MMGRRGVSQRAKDVAVAIPSLYLLQMNLWQDMLGVGSVSYLRQGLWKEPLFLVAAFLFKSV